MAPFCAALLLICCEPRPENRMAQLEFRKALENYPSHFTIVLIRPSFVAVGPGLKLK